MSNEGSTGDVGLFDQLRGFWLRLSRRRKSVIVTAGFLTIAAVGYASFQGGAGPYTSLYTGLSTDDAAEIVAALNEQKIPNRIGAGGSAIEVPENRVHEIRLAMASAGLPRGGGVGFEIFDEQNFGTTSFVEQVNYRRALQGELARSIGSLAAVESARVHVAMGQRSVFKDAEKPPTASVALRLRPGRQLTDEQVRGVVHLVASSVDGLTADDVVVIDDHGTVLSQRDDDKGEAAGAKAELEKTLSTRVQSLLDRIVGAGRAAVVVTAEMDYRQIDQTEEIYDKDAIAIRSEVRSMEGDKVPQETSGVAGARGNLPGTGEPTQTEGGDLRRLSETRNYEVPRVVRRTVEPNSRIRRIHVAVLVDHKLVPRAGSDKTTAGTGSDAPALDKDGNAAVAGKEQEKAGEKDANAAGGTEMVLAPRTEEELNHIAAIVREAAGLDESRGDRLEVRNVPFAEVDPEEQGDVVANKPLPWWLQERFIVAATTGLGLLVLLVAFLTIRRGMRGQREMASARIIPLPASISDVEKQLAKHQLSGHTGELASGRPAPQLGDGQQDVYGRVLTAVRADTGKAAKTLSALLEDNDKNGQKKAS